MPGETRLGSVRTELESAVQLAKCRQCGCLETTLKVLSQQLPLLNGGDASALLNDVCGWLNQLQPADYPCLGCVHCYPASAHNHFVADFPAVAPSMYQVCDATAPDKDWPVVPGEFFVLRPTAPVAVTTLSSIQLAEDLANLNPDGLAVTGKTETENIGIDKIIKNVVSNPAISHLVVAGVDPLGHFPGRTLLALFCHGVDINGRVIGSPAKQPLLRNVSPAEIDAYRRQVRVVNMLGNVDLYAIADKVARLASSEQNNNSGVFQVRVTHAPHLLAHEPAGKVTLDEAGYFVVVPRPEKAIISVEHYTYDHQLLRVIDGSDAKSIYRMIIERGWLTELSHAAYLGRELARAEYALNGITPYTQDGA